MTTAFHSPPRRRTASLKEASLLEGPMLLLRCIRGFSSNRSLLWLACVPISFLGLGLFNLSVHAAEDAGVTLSIEGLANNLWMYVTVGYPGVLLSSIVILISLPRIWRYYRQSLANRVQTCTTQSFYCVASIGAA